MNEWDNKSVIKFKKQIKLIQFIVAHIKDSNNNPMPILKQPKPPRFQVDNIFFTLSLIKAQIPIKFKCRFLVQIKSSSATSSLRTLGKSKDQYRQTASLITFDPDEKFNFSHFMVYDNELGKYKKTEIQILVSLVSDSRGDQTKLVGRVRVDLNEFMIDNQGKKMRKQHELENCSVKKPQVAKITYELSLIRQEKTNISENPDRQAIYTQIDRGVFPDALQYNQFGKEVFGKDFSMISISKINRSFNSESSSNRINDSLSKVNGSKEEQEGKVEQQSEQSQNISNRKQNISNSKYPFYKPPKQPINTSQQPILQRQHKKQLISQSSVTKPLKSSPIKRALQSPRQKSKINQEPISQQITQIQAQSQPKPNQLSQSMFQQQQMVIQSLQQQLQQANQMIEQYRLQMELMKEQTQRLQNEKSMHANQLQTSRARNLSGASLSQAIGNQYHQQNQSLKDQLQQYKQQLSECKKVFAEKQQIIQEKDHLINNLSAQIQMAAHQIDLRLSNKDILYNQLNQQYLLLKEQQIYMKGQIEKNQLIIQQKTQNNHIYSNMVNQLQAEIQTLTNLVHNSPVAQLNAQLQNKNLKITQLFQLLQKQKTTNTEHQLKLSDLQSTISQLNKSLNQCKLKWSKSQESAKRHQQLKQKAQQEMNKAVEKAKTIEKEKYQLTQQITNMNLSAKNIDKLVDEKVNSYKMQYDELALTYEQAQNKISQLKFAVQSYQSTLSLQQTKSQAQISQLTLKLQNFNKKEHLLRQSLDLLQNQSTKIRNFVQQKQTQLKDCEQLIRLKDQELSEKNDKLNYLQRKLRMNENTINDLKLQLKMANTMNLQTRQDRELKDGEEEYETRLFILNEANMQLVERQKHQAQLIDEKQQAIHEFKKLTTTIEPLKRQINSLQTKLQTSQQKHHELRQQLKTLLKNTSEQRSRSEQQQSELQHAYKQCEKLQEQLNLLEDEKILVLNQCQEKEQELMNVQDALNKMMDSKKALERQFQVKDGEITSIKKHLLESQKLNQQLTKRISHLQTSPRSQQHKKQQLLIQSRTLIKQQLQLLSAIRSPVKDIYTSPTYARSKEQEQIYRLNQELQAYKQREQSYMCNVLDLQEQLQQVRKEKLSSSMNEQRQSIRKSQSLQPIVSYDKNDLKMACDQLEKLIKQRIKNRQTQNLIQMIVSNSSQLVSGSQSRGTNEQGTLFARQKNSLQQKSRILSRQVQKIKSQILKKPDLPFTSKTEIIQMLKPCETITSELIKIGESFARDNQDEQMSEN